MANPLTSRTPLMIAFVIATILVGGFAVALLVNEDLRRYTIAQIEEITNEDGEKVKRVKIEKPEPNEKQVREISRNQERKKRDELKEKAKEMRETIYEIEEVVEAQKKLLGDKETEWDRLAEKAEELAQQMKEFNDNLAQEDTPDSLETAEPASQELTDMAEAYAEMVNQKKDESVTTQDAKEAALEARKLLNQAKDFQNKFNQATQRTPAEDKADAMELREEVMEFVAELEEHAKEMAQLEKSPYANLEQSPEAETTDLADTELANDPSQNGELEDGETTTLGNELPSDQQLDEMTTAELYEQIQEMSEMVDEAFAEGQAADLANRKDMSLQRARDEVFKPESDKGPDLQEALSQNQPSTREEFQQFNEALENAASAAQQMARTANNRKESLTGQSAQQSGQGQSSEQLQASLQQGNELRAQMNLLASNAGRRVGNVQDMRALMAENYSLTGGGSMSGEGFRQGQAVDMNYQTAMEHESPLPKQAHLDTNRTLAQAVPGRRLDKNSARQGWIFLDTWYVIGPWQRPNQRESFEVEFPPETLVDLDATYTGKVSRFTKENMELKWRFVQTENIRINPPDEISDAVYYGYTEVFCETATEVTVAVASDDMAKLWINDLVVFEDSGLSPWRMDEGFRTILLKPGYNTVLIRLENGPSVCYFSVLMCPTEALRN
ncbi:hypothetical protein [Cerasicoccus fimbriatus]|uniref:hypothetical protein n=1 Tax=Cerasicoccus fimbriatus TaxID=3014554 RepID=UPI0022B501C7|nr:hypothetical protein [Cerasicoccus sp. TK19100]